MFSFGYFYTHPLSALLLWVNLIYFFVNAFKFTNAGRADDLPRRAFYNQLFKGNLFLVFSGLCAGTMGESSPGFGLWFLIGLWYVCTPWMRRKKVKKDLEAANTARLQAAEAARRDANDSQVWPPPPQV